MLLLAWLTGFALCQVCLLDIRLWWAGLIVFVIWAIAAKAYRGGRDEILMLICYGLMWPFFAPMLGRQRLLQRQRVRTIKPEELKPFKLEL